MSTYHFRKYVREVVMLHDRLAVSVPKGRLLPSAHFILERERHTDRHVGIGMLEGNTLLAKFAEEVVSTGEDVVVLSMETQE